MTNSASATNQFEARRKVVVIHDPERKALHFTGTKLQGDDVWFPCDSKAVPSHIAIENIMTLNHVAHNVTSIAWIRQCGICDEYLVWYNVANPEL